MAATESSNGRRSNSKSRSSGGRNSGSGRRSSGSRGKRASGSRRRISGLQRPLIDFNGIMATIDVMNVDDPEYEGTVEMFLSSRFQEFGPFLRMHRESQLVLKDQFVEYWTTLDDPEKNITPHIAGKIFDTYSLLGKGKSGVTPTQLTNLQKKLSRTFRTMNASGAERQLAKYSWYSNGVQKRDVNRRSQVLSAQKYEELIARLVAENQSLKDKVVKNSSDEGNEAAALRRELAEAREQIQRLEMAAPAPRRY